MVLYSRPPPMSVKIFFPSSPAHLTLKTGEKKNLRGLLEEHCPTLFRKISTPWWLKNGDIQTIYCVKGNFRHVDAVQYHRVHIGLLDGGTLGLDFTPLDHDKRFTPETPIVVVLPGLTGGSHEPYVRSLMSAIGTQGIEGYRAVVIHSRGCAGVPITSQQWYSGGNPEDFRQALMYIAHRYPKAPLLGVGFSVGSNILVKYLAQEGIRSRISAACIMACPWDLIENELAMRKTILGRYAYSRAMGRNLKDLLTRNAEALSTGSDFRITKAVNATLSLKRPRLQDFDVVMNSQAGGAVPVFPFTTLTEYYRWASSHTSLAGVRVPLLSVNAKDDPIVHKVPTGVDNPYVVMVLTADGGHLGWFEKDRGRGTTKRWIVKPVAEWLRVAATFEVTPRGEGLYMDDDNYIRIHERDDIGCKMVPGGGLIDGIAQDDIFQGL